MIYILICSNAWGEREEVTKVLSECDLITHWRYDLPNSYYLVSDNTANEIAKYLQEKFLKKRFILVEMNLNNVQGWLPKDTWSYFRKYKND